VVSSHDSKYARKKTVKQAAESCRQWWAGYKPSQIPGVNAASRFRWANVPAISRGDRGCPFNAYVAATDVPNLRASNPSIMLTLGSACYGYAANHIGPCFSTTFSYKKVLYGMVVEKRYAVA